MREKRKKRKKREASENEGGVSTLRTKQSIIKTFPGQGRSLNALSDDEGADDSNAAFTNSIRGLIDSIREATPENSHNVAIESLMRALEGGT